MVKQEYKGIDSLLSIGTSEEAVIATKAAILEILTARADQKTIRVALNAFTESVQVKNIVVSNCSFYNQEETK